ncbi:MAG: hypothetical protein HYS45_03030 [Parcubacteria group bacterium]|nr:hypothetical protein [Parcubacteria group bacterium]
MRQYLYRDKTRGQSPREQEVVVTEDHAMFVKDRDGNWTPGFEYTGAHTVKAHPFIIDALLEDVERILTLDEVLAALEGQ